MCGLDTKEFEREQAIETDTRYSMLMIVHTTFVYAPSFLQKTTFRLNLHTRPCIRHIIVNITLQCFMRSISKQITTHIKSKKTERNYIIDQNLRIRKHLNDFGKEKASCILCNMENSKVSQHDEQIHWNHLDIGSVIYK